MEQKFALLMTAENENENLMKKKKVSQEITRKSLTLNTHLKCLCTLRSSPLRKERTGSEYLFIIIIATTTAAAVVVVRRKARTITLKLSTTRNDDERINFYISS
jgi:hypothetical protein